MVALVQSSGQMLERLLSDILDQSKIEAGNFQLQIAPFDLRDEVEAAWNWIDPILQVWAAATEPPKAYTAGTWGPSAAIALIERDGRTWVETVA